MGKVLVVDDDQYLREVLTFMLRRLGHEVETAARPAEALEMLAAERFDAAIVDWTMPEMTGGELCARMREDPASADTPVMILTAHADEQTRTTALLAGADQFVTKPIKLADLASSVEALIATRA